MPCCVPQHASVLAQVSGQTDDAVNTPLNSCPPASHNLQSLRRWLTAGNYRCPRTNLDLVDAQVPAGAWVLYHWLMPTATTTATL
jgi:hypothetical protein